MCGHLSKRECDYARFYRLMFHVKREIICTRRTHIELILIFLWSFFFFKGGASSDSSWLSEYKCRFAPIVELPANVQLITLRTLEVKKKEKNEYFELVLHFYVAFCFCFFVFCFLFFVFFFCFFCCCFYYYYCLFSGVFVLFY